MTLRIDGKRRTRGHHVGSVILTDTEQSLTQVQAARREARPRSASPSESASTEDGEISPRDSYKHSRDSSYREREREQERERDRERDRRDDAKDSRAEKKEKKDLDAVPANRMEVNSARLSRYELVDLMFKDQFEEVITGVSIPSGSSGRD